MARLGRSAGRAVGRTREIDPAHRRDGLGVTFLVLAVITAAGVWLARAGRSAAGFPAAIGAVVGVAGVLLPLMLVVVGVVLVTTRRTRSRGHGSRSGRCCSRSACSGSCT